MPCAPKSLWVWAMPMQALQLQQRSAAIENEKRSLILLLDEAATEQRRLWEPVGEHNSATEVGTQVWSIPHPFLIFTFSFACLLIIIYFDILYDFRAAVMLGDISPSEAGWMSALLCILSIYTLRRLPVGPGWGFASIRFSYCKMLYDALAAGRKRSRWSGLPSSSPLPSRSRPTRMVSDYSSLSNTAWLAKQEPKTPRPLSARNARLDSQFATPVLPGSQPPSL